jgi:hypothetical protein
MSRSIKMIFAVAVVLALAVWTNGATVAAKQPLRGPLARTVLND